MPPNKPLDLISEDLVDRELSHGRPDQAAHVVRNFSVPVTSVRLQHHVAPLLRAQVEVDVAQAGQTQVGLKSRLKCWGCFSEGCGGGIGVKCADKPALIFIDWA